MLLCEISCKVEYNFYTWEYLYCSGILRCPAITVRTGCDTEDDSAGSAVGRTGYLHPRVSLKRCRSISVQVRNNLIIHGVRLILA